MSRGCTSWEEPLEESWQERPLCRTLGESLGCKGWVLGGTQQGECCWAALQPVPLSRAVSSPTVAGGVPVGHDMSVCRFSVLCPRGAELGAQSTAQLQSGSAAAQQHRFVSFLEDGEECRELVGTDKIKL